MRVNSHAQVTEGVCSLDMTGNVGAMGDTSKLSTVNLHHSQLATPDISITGSAAVIGKEAKPILPEVNHSL